jgi:hypothetical protein
MVENYVSKLESKKIPPVNSTRNDVFLLQLAYSPSKYLFIWIELDAQY